MFEKEVFVLINWKSNYILGEDQVWGWGKRLLIKIKSLDLDLLSMGYLLGIKYIKLDRGSGAREKERVGLQK